MTIKDRILQLFNRGGKREFVPGMFGYVSPNGVIESPPPEYGDYLKISSAVYTCATTRADLLSSLKPVLYKLNSQGEKKEINSGFAYELLQKVNDFWTFNRLIQMTELSLCTWGASFWFVERGASGKGRPQEIWWARPDHVEVKIDNSNYIDRFEFRPRGQGKPVIYAPSETVWFRYPNPLDEFEPLSPLSSIRISADYGLSALQTNRKLFDQGIIGGGLVLAKNNQGLPMSDTQAIELEEKINNRFAGKDKAHRWGVLRFEADVQPFSLSPRHAEFIQGYRLALEDVCRAYKVPLDLVGGQRTYENLNASLRAAWTHAILPEGRFVSGEITEQFLPMFKEEADLMEFDSSEVDVLQEAASEEWVRSKEQIERGAMTINEWRTDQGLKPVPWGDAWWASATLQPIDMTPEEFKNSKPEPQPVIDLTGTALPPGEEEPEIEEARGKLKRMIGAIEYGGYEHQALWRRFNRKASKLEREFAELMKELFIRQRDSVLTKLGRLQEADFQRGVDDALIDPFDLPEWIKNFKAKAKPLISEMFEEGADIAFSALDVILVFSLDNPRAQAFIERRAQRFATKVNETTWNDLRKVLSEAIGEGEPLTGIQERIRLTFEKYYTSDPGVAGKELRTEMIARTEVIGALNGGTLEGYRQSGLPVRKTWLAALDDRTRETHIQAHFEYNSNPIGLEEEFLVGAGRGLAPGEIGLPEEDIHCRCTMQPVVEYPGGF